MEHIINYIIMESFYNIVFNESIPSVELMIVEDILNNI